jgi:hypothetical protein
MPCCAWIIVLLLPRLALIGILIFTDWLQQAYETMLWPILGWLFMPYTTLAYMAAMVKGGGLQGGWVALLIVAVVADVGNWGGSGRAARRAS